MVRQENLLGDPVTEDCHANVESCADFATALWLDMYELTLDIVYILAKHVNMLLELRVELFSSNFAQSLGIFCARVVAVNCVVQGNSVNHCFLIYCFGLERASHSQEV